MIIPFIKNINFFELAKFMKITKSSANNKPLYKLPGSSELLPLSTITSINIPSIGESNDPFTAGCLRDSTQEQIYNVSDHIALCYMGYIKHSISALEEWSAVIHLSGFLIPFQGAADRGYDLINSDDFHFHLYYYSYFSSYMEVVLQDGVQSPTIVDNEFTRQYCTLNGDRIRINVDRTWMQNNGIGRIFKIGVKNNTVYFYIDDTLIGYQAKTLSIDSINVGEFPQRLQYFDSQYHAFVYDINDFSIYDKFIFDIPAYGYLSGNPPFTFNSNGNPLADYTISGNTIQNSTPTPDNPIMPEGTGERTENLLDTDIYYGTYKQADGTYQSTRANLYNVQIKPFKADDIGKTFTFIADISPITGNARLCANINGTIVSGSNTEKSVVTFTVETADDSIFFNYGSGSTTVTTLSEIILVQGSTALPYEPYGYKIPISSASTTTNIYLGEVQTTRKIKKLVLTGEENWSISGSGDATRFYINIADTVDSSSLYCTHFTNGIQTIIGNCEITASKNLVFNNSEIATTTANWKTWLQQQYAAGTPVTVWYVLAEPETGIVNEPLMKIGDYADTVSKVQAGVEIPTINGSNTLTVDTTLQPSEVSIVYENKIP